MGSSVSRLPENLTEQECKKLAGIRWDSGLSEVFASAEKNEDGTISKTRYLEHFRIDPFQVKEQEKDLERKIDSFLYSLSFSSLSSHCLFFIRFSSLSSFNPFFRIVLWMLI